MATHAGTTRAARTTGLSKRVTHATVRKAVRSLHVYPSAGSKWLVRGIGLHGVRRLFASKHAAVTFARDSAARSDLVVVHSKRVRLRAVKPSKNGLYEVVYVEG